MQANLKAYWLLLKDLSFEDKVFLIQMLLQSLRQVPAKKTPQKEQTSPAENDNWVYEVNGSWKDFSESAEDLISLIEGSRTMGRPIEEL